MSCSKTGVMLPALIVALLLVAGCNREEVSGPSPENKKQAEEAADRAADSLEAMVARMQNLEQYQYGKEDLTALGSAHADFEAALRLDPDNSRAKLGRSLTGVALAAQSDRLSSVVNQAIEAKSPFDARTAQQAPQARIAVLKRVAAQAQFPEFHEIQEAVADTLLPALESAIADLEDVRADAGFSLTLEIDGQSKELDHAEVSILLAGVKAMHALFTLYLSYDVDIDDAGSYDFIRDLESIGGVEDFSLLSETQKKALDHITGLLSPGSPFLAVKPAWKQKLAGVDDEIREALVILKQGLASVKTESDDQADDLLRLCSVSVLADCVDGEDLDQGLSFADSGLKYLDQPYGLRIDEIDSTIHLDFAAYLRIEDFKKFLPYYGFYPSAEWSEEKPVFYFTDAQGNVTGNLRDVERIADEADSLGKPAAEVVARLRTIIHLQDPTFQGYLPGATEDDVWALIRKLAEAEEENETVYVPPPDEPAPGPSQAQPPAGGSGLGAGAGTALATLNPGFALGLLNR